MVVVAVALTACSKSNTKTASSSSGSAGTNAGNGSSTATTTAGSNGTGGSNASSATNGSGGTSATNGGSSGGTSGSSCTGVDALAISPATSNVTLTGGTASPITFTASGTRGGSNVTVAASDLTWTVTRADDSDPGTISNGVYQPNTSAGGTVTITATGCGQSATATVTFFLDYSATSVTDGGTAITSTDFSGADGGVVGAKSPQIVYPSDATRFPRNIYKVLFQWKRQGNSLFRLNFTGTNSVVTVYTDGNDPTCAAVATTAGCWQADATTWSAIAGSNAGSTVDLEIDGAVSSGTTVYASTHETLGFSKRDVPGAIFYWAASVGGIQRATVSDAAPENYLVPTTVLSNSDTVSCAACHALSRDGRFMAVSGQATGPATMNHGLWNMQVTPYPPPVPLQAQFASPSGDSFASFSPDDAKLIFSPRNGGQLLVLDADGGNILASAVDGTAQR